jgi:hypothetical protein
MWLSHEKTKNIWSLQIRSGREGGGGGVGRILLLLNIPGLVWKL